MKKDARNLQGWLIGSGQEWPFDMNFWNDTVIQVLPFLPTVVLDVQMLAHLFFRLFFLRNGFQLEVSSAVVIGFYETSDSSFHVQIFNTVGDLRNLTQNACANRLCNEVPDFQLVIDVT